MNDTAARSARADIAAKIAASTAAFVDAETAARNARAAESAAESAAVSAIISGVAEMYQMIRDYRAVTANLSAVISANIAMANATDYSVCEITDGTLDILFNTREFVESAIEVLETERDSIRNSAVDFFAEIAFNARFISEWDYSEMRLTDSAPAVFAAIESHSLFDGNGGDTDSDGEFWDVCRETRRALSAFETICNGGADVAAVDYISPELREIIAFLSE